MRKKQQLLDQRSVNDHATMQLNLPDGGSGSLKVELA
jgi:hypothetical protein